MRCGSERLVSLKKPESADTRSGRAPRFSSTWASRGRNCCLSLASSGQGGGHDDLRLLVHSGVSVVGLHEGLAGSVQHDAGIRIGEVPLGFGVGFCLLGVGDGGGGL